MSIILCADDFGLSAGVSEGILDLIAASRVSATSALVTTGAWPRMAPLLAAAADRAAIGLHLNLTFGSPLGRMPKLARSGRFPTVASLMTRAVIGALDLREITVETVRQLDRFEQCLGRSPDFIDGHEHVHVLPGIRDALLSVIGMRFQKGRLLIRDPSDKPTSILRRKSLFKAMIVKTLATNFRTEVERFGFHTNYSFAGFSSFDQNRPFDQEFELFLLCASPRHLVMCHPGLPHDENSTPHSARRAEEYRYLMRREDLPVIIWHPDRHGTDRIQLSRLHDARGCSIESSGG